jgi:hypothetical protein
MPGIHRTATRRQMGPDTVSFALTAVYSSVVMNGERHCSQDRTFSQTRTVYGWRFTLARAMPSFFITY